MEYETIKKLLDKHITLIFLSLFNDNIITKFSIDNNNATRSKQYTYYFKQILGDEFYISTSSYRIDRYSETIEIYKFHYGTEKYKFEQIKSEEDIINIAEAYKQEILKEIYYHILWNVNYLIPEFIKGIPMMLSIDNEIKKLFIEEIKESSSKLVDIINENLLSYTPIENSLSNDNSLSAKKKVKLGKNNDKILFAETTKRITINGRVGQHSFRKKLLQMYDKCAICGLDIIPLLKASHIRRWEFSNNKEKRDRYNGLLLCPNHDELFDKGYITFTDEGNIIISKLLDEKVYNLLNINPNISINIKDETKKYLKWHREEWFLDNKQRTTR